MKISTDYNKKENCKIGNYYNIFKYGQKHMQPKICAKRASKNLMQKTIEPFKTRVQ